MERDTNGYEQRGINMNVECEKEERKGVRPSILDMFEKDIIHYLEIGLPTKSIMKLVNDRFNKLGIREVSERAMRYYINNRIKAK